MTWSYEIPGKAVPLERPRFVRGRKPFLPKKSRDYRELIQKCVLAQGKPETLILGPVYLTVIEHRATPESWTKAKKRQTYYSTTRPDLTNVVKAIEDALNGLVWKDDAQVAWCNFMKVYDFVEPRVTVSVREL